MQWRLSDQDQAFVLMFLVDGQYVIPDSGSVVASLRGNDGSLLGGTVATTVSGTQATAVTTSLQNSLPDGKLFEARYLQLDYAVNGVPCVVKHPYRIHKFIPHTVDCDTVRALVGAEFQELPDSAIDVTAAYFSLVNSYGTRLSDALVRSDIASIEANNAIALKAAVELCHSLPTRLLQIEKSDTSQAQRSDVDFLKLEEDLKGKLTASLDIITGILEGRDVPVAITTLFSVTKQTDAITGA